LNFSKKNIARIYAFLGILAWFAFISIDLLNIVNGLEAEKIFSTIVLPKALFVLLFFFALLFYRFEIAKQETINIIDLTWKVFVTGLITTIASLLTRYLLAIAQYKPPLINKVLNTIIYDVNIGLIVIFLSAAFVVWKKLILYQKSKNLLRAWHTFEIAVFASLLLTFTQYHLFDTLFNVVLGLFILASLVLSANLKWVAYLNFKQKWKNILLLILVSLYLWYFFVTISNFTSRFAPDINVIDNVTVLILFAFCFIYAVFSILVLLFNLPTSSVFEQKLEEVINFQKLSQSANADQEGDQIYEILLESSVSAVIANAAWLEIFDGKSTPEKTLFHKIGKSRIEELDRQIGPRKVENFSIDAPLKNLKKSQFIVNLKDEEFKSALIFPLVVQGNHYGTLYLLKDLHDGFNREMVEIIRSFVNQACISLENHQLIQEAIENERYKEELEIAKRVQGSLLPKKLDKNDDFDVMAYSKAAAEVGGDYYDTYRINESKIALIIGDVSGKGTSAAFHMAQMKGIFQSLSQMDLPVKEFMSRANIAVSNCLDKKSLITVAYFIIDQSNRSVQLARAGHCPTLYYRAGVDKAEYFETRGIGLGMLRDDRFDQYIDVYEVNYKPGDVVLLYTDGITEARNGEGHEFGYDKLLHSLSRIAKQPVDVIQRSILDDIYDFCGKSTPDDDFTTLVIKFK